MPTFGKTTNGANSSSSSASRVWVSSGSPASTGQVVDGRARVWLTGADTVPTKFVIYADSAGTPGAKLAESDILNITNTAEAELTWTFSGANLITVTSGTTYWIGVAWEDPGTLSISVSRDGTASQRYEQGLTWPTVPDPYGTPAANTTGPIDAYVNYASVTKTETFTDDFNDNSINPTTWPNNFGTGQAETGGTAQVTPTTTLSGWGSQAIYTLADSYALVKMTPPGNPVGSTFANARFTIYASTAYSSYARILVDTPTQEIRLAVAVSSTFEYSSTSAYDSAQHKWFRIRETSGTIHFEVSATGGAGSWSSLGSYATPTVFQSSGTCEIDFESQIQSGTAITPAIWDNLNLPPVIAGVATATGAAQPATTRAAPSTAAATAIGAALGATARVSTTAVAAAAAGTGTANDATAATGVSVSAGAATATGAASEATARISASAVASTATGAANDAAAAISGGAETATGTVTALGAASRVTSTAEPATATATALGATARLSPTTTTAPGAGQAYDATTTSSGSALAGTATGAGDAPTPSASIWPTGATATATGAARDASVTVEAGTAALAQTAQGTGESQPAKPAVAPAAGVAQGTGEALSASTRASPTSGVAQGAGQALDASVASSVLANAQVATATGESPDALVLGEVRAQVAVSTGTARNATVVISQSRQGDALPAAATATAHGATVMIGAWAESATGLGQGRPAVIAVAPSAATATAEATALDAAVDLSVSREALAEVASGQGLAWSASGGVAVTAGTSQGLGSAHDASVTLTAVALAEVATGSGQAHGLFAGVVVVGQAVLSGFGEIRAVEINSKVPDGLSGTIEVTFRPVGEMMACAPSAEIQTCVPTAEITRSPCG